MTDRNDRSRKTLFLVLYTIFLSLWMVTSAFAPTIGPGLFALGSLIGICGAATAFWMYHDLERSNPEITGFALANLSVGLFLVYLEDFSPAPVFLSFPGFGMAFFGWYMLVDHHMTSNGLKLTVGTTMAFLGFISLLGIAQDNGWLFGKTGIWLMALGIFTLVMIPGPHPSRGT